MSVIGIAGERIRMVPLERSHLDKIVVWFNDPEVTRWIQRDMPVARAHEDKWFEHMLESRDDLVWAVHDEGDRHIGVTGIHRIDWKNRNALTGTVLGEKSAWGRGYGTDVMRTRTRWAFETLGMHRLQSESFVANEASRHCLEKVGYRIIGTARQRFWRGGQWHDVYLWEILEQDWFEKK